MSIIKQLQTSSNHQGTLRVSLFLNNLSHSDSYIEIYIILYNIYIVILNWCAPFLWVLTTNTLLHLIWNPGSLMHIFQFWSMYIIQYTYSPKYNYTPFPISLIFINLVIFYTYCVINHIDFSAKETKIMINPRGVKIVANTVGFFIANDAEEVRRANAFCKVSFVFRETSKTLTWPTCRPAMRISRIQT